ncbi:hypothetical protein FTUN_6403 [Frigoriglobus tundricola]|uniref:Uncharacterized protein n=1 Tax=Frigoriglobus tundricola TaxID=2774151 RepID=A0A6M5YY62_9BACT|nr:hypothetical protein FTUN_6403 [Frigoriglobus tundricola]
MRLRRRGHVGHRLRRHGRLAARGGGHRRPLGPRARPPSRRPAFRPPGASAPGASAPGASAPGASTTGASAPGASAPGASAPGASTTGASALGASPAGASAAAGAASTGVGVACGAGEVSSCEFVVGSDGVILRTSWGQRGGSVGRSRDGRKAGRVRAPARRTESIGQMVMSTGGFARRQGSRRCVEYILVRAEPCSYCERRLFRGTRVRPLPLDIAALVLPLLAGAGLFALGRTFRR